MSKELYSQVLNIYRDNDGRIIILDLKQSEHICSIATIYAPNEDNPKFFQHLGNLLRERQEHKLIIGDFNLVLDVNKDRRNTYCNNNKARDEVLGLMEEFSLKDTWRMQNVEKEEFSWFKHQRNKEIKASRIDLALVSGGLDQRVQAPTYLSSIKTDHRALYMVIEFNSFERGTGYWKFNNTLLQDKSFLQQMNTEIETTLKTSEEKSPREKWENLKVRIKKLSTRYSRNKVSEEKLVIAQLSEAVNEYEANLPLRKEEYEIYSNTKEDLQDKVFERTKGVMFRSKAKWYEQGEKNTKYFYSLEKAKYNAKTCYKLITERGQEIENPIEILQEQRDFYAKLYEVDKDVDFSLTNNYNIHVPQEIQEMQNQQITLEELEQAIKLMNNNKTPGEDGIPVDFYKVFWTKIKEPFYNMMCECFEKEELHQSARRGILNLIPKADKDTRFVKNLRPITLLNTDYKIIEKAIANKMLPALEHIIHTDQRGFMKNRRISVNIRKMLDIIHHAEKEDLEAIVMSLDFVKCFDKCSFTILHGSLEFFKFGDIVKQWTKILYHNFTVKVQNNGHFSKPLKIEKGVHQGGCCSSLYFLVIAEILALSLRSNNAIEGITIADIRNLLNQFADDTDIFSAATESSIKALHKELQDFRKQSGFTVSYDKTTLYRIGSLRHSDAQMYNIDEFKWSNQDIQVLGVTISHEDIVYKNYIPLVEKTKGILNAWYNRNLSLIGKVQVVNTLVASLFVHKMMVLPTIPKGIVKNLDNLIRDFLWDGKKSKIAYSILQNQKKEGGLNLVNLTKKDIALKTTWPQILCHETEYAVMVYRILRCSTLKQNIWRCSLKEEDVSLIKVKNFFWECVLKAWCKFNYYLHRKVENQIIWYNSNIRIRNRPVLWNDVLSRGLLYVHQLFSEGSFKENTQVWDEFGLTPIRFNSLKAAIPLDWRDFFKQTLAAEYMPIPPHNYDRAITCWENSLSRMAYDQQRDDILLVHNKFIKWKMELGEQYDSSLMDFGRQHLDIYRTTNVPKLRSFQYRIIQRALVTNVLLHKWEITDTAMCSFCDQYEETVLHLFTQCQVVMKVWEGIKKFVYEEYKICINTNPTAIILNKMVEGSHHIVNTICLIDKQYIYSQRCLKKEMDSVSVIARIRNVERIEKYIAVKNNRMEIHLKKWMRLSNQSELNENMSSYVETYIDQNM